jgi:L,D-transpeptidase catalytic domain
MTDVISGSLHRDGSPEDWEPAGMVKQLRPVRKGLRLSIVVITLAVVGAALTFRFWPHDTLPAGIRADLIVVNKSEKTLALIKDGQVIRSYAVALGRHPRGHKVEEGDGRTAEGRYVIQSRNPNSRFFRALHVSYPNAEDVRNARKLHVSPGGDIMVHGIKNGFGWVGRLHRLIDWTDGCIAVTMRDIWNATTVGVLIEIRP